jgi:hypothetical protein
VPDLGPAAAIEEKEIDTMRASDFDDQPSNWTITATASLR